MGHRACEASVIVMSCKLMLLPRVSSGTGSRQHSGIYSHHLCCCIDERGVFHNIPSQLKCECGLRCAPLQLRAQNCFRVPFRLVLLQREARSYPHTGQRRAIMNQLQLSESGRAARSPAAPVAPLRARGHSVRRTASVKVQAATPEAKLGAENAAAEIELITLGLDRGLNATVRVPTSC